jgi:hypothetical protein
MRPLRPAEQLMLVVIIIGAMLLAFALYAL